MWLVDVYSKGDLLNDDYLQVNQHTEKNEMGEYFETYDTKYNSCIDIEDRINLINSCIERLQAEKEHLQKYGEKLVLLGSYANLGE